MKIVLKTKLFTFTFTAVHWSIGPQIIQYWTDVKCLVGMSKQR